MANDMAPARKGARTRQLTKRLHALGEKPLYHFVRDLERGGNIQQTLEAYAALPAELVKAYRGDVFTLPFVIRK